MLIYPHPDIVSQQPLASLFSEPVAITIDNVRSDSVYLKFMADTRLVVARREIYERNGQKFAPTPDLRIDAHRRAFYAIAQKKLKDTLFYTMDLDAWSQVEEE